MENNEVIELESVKRRKKLEEMDIKTLEIIYSNLDDILNSLKQSNPKSKSIIGMELSLQFIFDYIAEKKH